MPENYTVQAFMSSQLVTLNPDMDILEAVRILTERGIPGAPVADDLGNLVGLLAEKDCLEAVLKASYYGEWGGRVSEYMQKEVTTVDAELSIFDAARLCIDTRHRGFPVITDEQVNGWSAGSTDRMSSKPLYPWDRKPLNIRKAGRQSVIFPIFRQDSSS